MYFIGIACIALAVLLALREVVDSLSYARKVDRFLRRRYRWPLHSPFTNVKGKRDESLGL